MLTFFLAFAAQSPCPTIQPGFADSSPVLDTVHALVAEGGGSLVAGGQFLFDRVEQWDGASWSRMGSGLPGTVLALARCDLGAGPRTYAGGEFTGAVAEWSNGAWSALSQGPAGTVRALASFDDGTGVALYAAGSFTSIGGGTVGGLARWDGSAWSAVAGSEFGATVRALAVHDEGGGPALYAAGDFLAVGSVAASRIARWDGTGWTALGAGTQGAVYALASHQGQLFAGGDFASAGGVPAAFVARWDGSQWHALASGTDARVTTLAVHDDGGGARLFAGGDFAFAGGIASRAVAAWDGSGWSACAAGLGGGVRALATFDSGAGAQLCAAGNFSLIGGQLPVRLARWTGVEWRALAEGPSSFPLTVATYDSGSGPSAYLGGSFVDAGGVTVGGLARWADDRWESMGGVAGANATVHELAVADVGEGPELLIGGDFTLVDGIPATRVARWNGQRFATVGGGLPAVVNAFAADGAGPGMKLYAGTPSPSGFFPVPDSSAVAVWSGGAWSPVGHLRGGLRALAVFDDGSGPTIYAGGNFELSAQHHAVVVRWSGSAWISVGPTTTTSSLIGPSQLLVVGDGASSSLLAAGGNFQPYAGPTIEMLARWNGVDWSSLGYREAIGENPAALALFDDGSGRGTRLFAAAGGLVNPGIHVLDGATWSTVVPLVADGFAATALSVLDRGDSARELWLAGRMWRAGDVDAEGVAVLRACDETGLSFCLGDGSEAPCPCGNASDAAARAGCRNSTGNGGALRARGRASVTHDSLVLEGSGMTNSSVLYFQAGTRIAPFAFGDGLACTGGPFVRLATRTNSGGASSHPTAGDPPISVRGFVTTPGTRHYAARYRDAAAYCTTATFDYTNAVTIAWGA